MYVLPHKKYIMRTKQSAMLLLQICHVVGIDRFEDLAHKT